MDMQEKCFNLYTMLSSFCKFLHAQQFIQCCNLMDKLKYEWRFRQLLLQVRQMQRGFHIFQPQTCAKIAKQQKHGQQGCNHWHSHRTIKILIMLEQQSCGAQELNYNSKQQKMDRKYDNFYADVELVPSEDLNSDLDNLEPILNAVNEGQYQVYCLSGWEREQIRRNPRVADVPTVYLVTCIKTQYLPERECWLEEQTQRQEFCQNPSQLRTSASNIMRQAESTCNHPNLSKLAATAQKSSCAYSKFRPPFRIRRNSRWEERRLERDALYCIRWKTDYIIIKRDQHKNKKRGNRFLYKFEQINPGAVGREISREKDKPKVDGRGAENKKGQQFVEVIKNQFNFMHGDDRIYNQSQRKPDQISPGPRNSWQLNKMEHIRQIFNSIYRNQSRNSQAEPQNSAMSEQLNSPRRSRPSGSCQSQKLPRKYRGFNFLKMAGPAQQISKKLRTPKSNDSSSVRFLHLQFDPEH